MPYKNPEKRRECRRRWYHNNKESEKAHIIRRKKEIRDWLAEYKSKLKCSVCWENHPATIDFHHKIKSKKEFNVTFMSYFGYSIDRIKKEIEKCIILCANCHRKLHYRENNNLNKP